MLRFFNRSSSSAFDFGLLGTDIHSHILPGIDDGARDMRSSLELIRGMSALGYKKLIATPHVMWDMYQNTSAIILDKLASVKEEVRKEGIPVEIEAAAEYFLDDHVVQLVKSNTALLTLGNRMVLVEFSLAHASLELKDILFELQMQSYVPVIAHPERYIYFDRAREFYDELKDMGCLFQLNVLSLTGGYGRTVQELAQYLIKKGYYDLAGTDLHHTRHLDSLHSSALGTQLRKLVENTKLLNNTL
jgi:tyrosine-protein phosphatase YwqE